MEEEQKTVKVKSLWNIGYDGEDRPAGTVFWCDPEWAERKAGGKKRKVEILEKKEPQKPTPPPPQFSTKANTDKSKQLLSMNVHQAAEVISETENVVLLDVWQEEEKADANRKMVLDAIDRQLKRLAEGGG